MSMERWHRAGDAAEDLRLLRRYEPVLRFTRGELFLPMSVPAYLERCGLWQSAESVRSRRRRLLAAWRRLTRLLLPWTRDREGTAFGIPFIDYRRGTA